jgi:hypothetical protein
LLAFASLKVNLRALMGLASSSLIPAPDFAAPALTAKDPAGQDTETVFVAPAGTLTARKAVRPETTCEVAEAATIKAAAANAAVSHLPMPQSPPRKKYHSAAVESSGDPGYRRDGIRWPEGHPRAA